ncbi:polyhydroxyalkanoic acid system family protein [candidate division KSB1 bacterium]|nr:polyhydroxyalkanoic acid system family protein [candidate division KSB1 bacterium]
MTIEHYHHLSQSEVVSKINDLLESFTNPGQYNVSDIKKSWNDDNSQLNFSFKLQGVTIQGFIALKSNSILLESTLPPLARFFEGKIKSFIREKMEEIF